MASRTATIEWRGRKVQAWLPEPLAARDLALDARTARLTEQAVGATRRGSDELPARWEPLARLLLRSEGLASSAIEGVNAPLAEVVAAELDPSVGEPAAWVADNLAAVREAIADAGHGPLTIGTLHGWHCTLMRGTRHLPEHLIGAFRDAPSWIGGTSPLDAALVPPPPDAVPALMDDLVAFANRDDIDAVTQAAVAHAQFEVIHPYGDGNGRVGRILIAWILTCRLQLVSAPPVSVRLATDRGGYLSGLTHFRLGELDAWVRWFADVVRHAADATVDLVRRARELTERWSGRLTGVRADAGARRLLEILPEQPVLSAATAAAALAVSERAAREALRTLAARDVVQPFDPVGSPTGRPRHWWVAGELLDLVTSWAG